MKGIGKLPEGFEVFASFEDVVKGRNSISEDWLAQQDCERAVLQSGKVKYQGYCAWCSRVTNFNFRNVIESTEPNWRESLACSGCGLINRWRAALHLFSSICGDRTCEPIYVTEQVTPLFKAFRKRFPGAIGSEYVNAKTTSGDSAWWRFRRVRHEDATRLSFSSGALASVLSFDVLEHVPNYLGALREFARVLSPGGLLLLTVPFLFFDPTTRVRANVSIDGSINHLLPPMYHGDPLNGRQGVLCCQEFGWDLLDDLRRLGFSHVRLIKIWNPRFGYLGSFQTVLVASR